MYSLFNVIKFGLQQAAKKNDRIAKISDDKLDSLRLDFLSGIYFRVFENLILNDNDPDRFKLHIMINYGSILDPDTINNIEDHTIPISIDNVYQKTLTLDDIDSFFITLLDMQNIGKTS